MAEFTHPICQLIQGRRLYYILLDLHADLNKSQTELNKLIEKHELKKLSCSYFVFGEADILVRIWSADNTLNQLINDIDSSFEIGVREIFLVSRTSTWYQREIENESEWNSSITNRNIGKHRKAVKNIIEGDVPRKFKLIPKPEGKAKKSKTKVFLFIRNLQGNNATLFRAVENILQNGDKYWKKAGANYSIYNIYSLTEKDNFGILLKLDISNFSTNSHKPLDFAVKIGSEIQCETLTYIVSRLIDAETDTLIPRKPVHPVLRESIVKNLLLTDSTSPLTTITPFASSNSKMDYTQGALGASDSSDSRLFIKLFSENEDIFHSLFNYDNKEWSKTISRLRLFYNFILNRNNDAIIGWIINDVITIERTIRRTAFKLRNIYKQNNLGLVIEELQPKSTLNGLIMWVRKSATSYCRKLKSSDDNTYQIDTHALKTALLYLDILSIDRNWLSHGYVEYIFKTTEQFITDMSDQHESELQPEDAKRLNSKTFLWETIVNDYALARLHLPQ